MTNEEALQAVRTALARIAPEADIGTVPPGSSLRAELDLDSIDFLALVEDLAVLTGVSIPESDYAEVDEVGRLTAYLSSHAAAA